MPDPEPLFPIETEDFVEEGLDPKEEREKAFTDLQKIRVRDAKLRYWARIVGGFFVGGLLLWQNIQVFHLVWTAVLSGQLTEMTTILGIIVPATLAETAYMVHTMVKWIFRDTDYSRQD